MHSPETVAFEIRRPWPEIRKRPARDSRPWLKLRYPWAVWYTFWKPGTWYAFWGIGPYELYWPGLVTIWHNEPGGRDSGTVCSHWKRDSKTGKNVTDRSWRWHVHHWSIKVRPLQNLRRWALTRCEWCGGRSTKQNRVNHSRQWYRDKEHWWRGERGLYHGRCSAVHAAHQTCICEIGPWEHGAGGTPYGACVNCGSFRPWRKESPSNHELNATLLLQLVGEGKAPSDDVWEIYLAEWAKEKADDDGMKEQLA